MIDSKNVTRLYKISNQELSSTTKNFVSRSNLVDLIKFRHRKRLGKTIKIKA